MAPPKKDAFADLFQSAAGNSNSSLNSSMNNLSVRDSITPSNRTNSPSMDVLSPSSYRSPQVSKPPAPSSQADFDPFSIFDQEPPANPAQVQPTQSSANVSASRVHQHQPSDFSLLDDEFVDVFQPSNVEKTPSISTNDINNRVEDAAPTPPSRPSSTSSSVRMRATRETDERDTVLAELVDIGFSLSVSNRAIDEVGPDLQACVNHIMNNGRGTGDNGNSSVPSDLGTALQDISTDFLRKATSIFDKSKRTVIKNINQFQAYHGKETNPDGMPAWMREQEKYKERASERKKGGGVYVDYGNDEENINKEEIQRIIRAQKQRERERQRERLENMKTGSEAKYSGSISEGSIPTPKTRDGSSRQPSPSITSNATPLREASVADQALRSSSTKGNRATQSQAPKEETIDLLGLGSSSHAASRAEQFKSTSGNEEVYISPSRRRSPKTTVPKVRNATNETLNAFQQSDYETFKASASTAFSNGNYDEAYQAYTRCLESLPLKHELRIVVLSNLAITLIKVGNYKSAMQSCDDGMALIGDITNDTDWVLNSKPIKYWYLRLLTRKAESLEMLENFPESLACYLELIAKHNVTDKKVLDAKRRINKIVNPPKPAPKNITPASKTASPTPSDAEAVKRIRDQHNQEKVNEEKKFRLHDQVHSRISEWTKGKEDNLRSLLMSLSEVLPPSLGFPFITDKKITINDLMLTKKVKINYMKVISSIHPDKLGKYELEEQMICQGVFVALNKAWDSFKEQNNMV